MVSDIRAISRIVEEWIRAVARGDEARASALWADRSLVVAAEGPIALPPEGEPRGHDMALSVLLLCGRHAECAACAEVMEIRRYEVIRPGIVTLTIAPRQEVARPEDCPLVPMTLVLGREPAGWRIRMMAPVRDD